MRISTGMIYDAGVASINSQTSTMMHLQQQVSSGRRILTPADDPVAAALALDVTQARDVTAQYGTNQDNASATLGLEEANLSSANDLLNRVRQLAVQAGNTSLTNTDRVSIAMELRSRFDELLGIANATDGTGQYLFSGNMGNTKPFGGTVVTAAAGGISYFGDDGQRKLQMSASRQLEVSDSGNSVFRRIASGNGYFSTGYNAANAGTGVIDAGNVTNPANWNNAANSGNLQVSFWVDTANVMGGGANATYYDLIDVTANKSLFTGLAPATGVGGSYTHPFVPDQPISLSQAAAPAFDFGATVTISGAPASGDSFSLKKSQSQDVFQTLGKLITSIEQGSTASAANTAKLANDIGFALSNIDQANNNVLQARAAIGSRLNELDSLKTVNSSLDLQYQATLSNLQDVDYAKTLSDLTRTQTQLQAAQKSFVQVSQMSIFNYIT